MPLLPNSTNFHDFPDSKARRTVLVVSVYDLPSYFCTKLPKFPGFLGFFFSIFLRKKILDLESFSHDFIIYFFSKISKEFLECMRSLQKTEREHQTTSQQHRKRDKRLTCSSTCGALLEAAAVGAAGETSVVAGWRPEPGRGAGKPGGGGGAAPRRGGQLASPAPFSPETTCPGALLAPPAAAWAKLARITGKAGGT